MNFTKKMCPLMLHYVHRSASCLELVAHVDIIRCLNATALNPNTNMVPIPTHLFCRRTARRKGSAQVAQSEVTRKMKAYAWLQFRIMLCCCDKKGPFTRCKHRLMSPLHLLTLMCFVLCEVCLGATRQVVWGSFFWVAKFGKWYGVPENESHWGVGVFEGTQGAGGGG